MGKLSSYNIVSSVSSGDYIPMFRSGVNNSAILPSSLISGAMGFTSNSGKIAFTDGGRLVWTSIPGLSNQVIFNSGGALGTSSNFIYDWTNNRFGFHGPNNAAFPVSFVSGIGPSGNSSVNFGSAAYRWGSGYFDMVNSNRFVVNSGLSGAAFMWPVPISYSFPSGSVTGVATNASFEVEIMYPSIIDVSGAYPAARIRSKVAGSGHPSGLTVDLKLNNTSIWSVNSGNRLKMANNTRSGTQNSFDYSGVMQPGDVMTIDFVYVPSSVYANDIVIELATLAQR